MRGLIFFSESVFSIFLPQITHLSLLPSLLTIYAWGWAKLCCSLFWISTEDAKRVSQIWFPVIAEWLVATESGLPVVLDLQPQLRLELTSLSNVIVVSRAWFLQPFLQESLSESRFPYWLGKTPGIAVNDNHTIPGCHILCKYMPIVKHSNFDYNLTAKL